MLPELTVNRDFMAAFIAADKNLFVGSLSQFVRCRLQLSVELLAVPGKGTIRADHR